MKFLTAITAGIVALSGLAAAAPAAAQDRTVVRERVTTPGGNSRVVVRERTTTTRRDYRDYRPRARRVCTVRYRHGERIRTCRVRYGR